VSSGQEQEVLEVKGFGPVLTDPIKEVLEKLQVAVLWVGSIWTGLFEPKVGDGRTRDVDIPIQTSPIITTYKPMYSICVENRMFC